MPLRIEDALQHVAPDLDDEQRDENGMTAKTRSAMALVMGTAANDAYWDSRSDLEQLLARSQGHGTVQRGADAEATAVEEPQTLPTGAEAPTGATTGAGELSPGPSPTGAGESDDALARLREQVRNLGGNPEA